MGDRELMLAKDETIIRIPTADVELYSKYDINNVFQKIDLLKEPGHGKEKGR